MSGTDLVVTSGADSNFLALRMGEDELKSIIAANIGAATIDAGMLDRVKMPSGGQTVWSVPTMDGEDNPKVLEGVIMKWGTRRVYWKSKFGEGEPGELPQCASDDGFIGVGDPGGDCQSCPLNEYGTGTNAKGEPSNAKACTELRQLFILQENSIIPIILNVTPGSLRVMSQYFMRLLRAGVASTGVVTQLALEKDKNDSNIEYSKIVPSAGPRLDPEARARIEDLAVKLAPAFERASRDISKEDVKGAGGKD